MAPSIMPRAGRRMSAATSLRCTRACRPRARSSPKRSTRLTASMRSPAASYTWPAIATTGTPSARGERRDAADHLALEALLVEEALAGDHEVGALEALVEADLVGHQVEPAHQLAAGRRQPTAEPAGGAGALEREHVDAVLVEVHLGEPLEATTQQLDLGRRRALLRREHRGRVEERDAAVARHDQLDALQPAERVQGAQRAPARRRWWPTRPARRSPGGRRRRAPSTISSPVPVVDAATGSLPSAPPTSSRPEAAAISITAVRPSSRHAASTGAPSGPVTVVDAVGAAERVERALAAVGHRDLVAVPAQLEGGVADRLGDRRPRTRCLGSLSGAATTRTPPCVAPLVVSAHRSPALGYGGPSHGRRSPRPADRPRVQPRPGVLRAGATTARSPASGARAGWCRASDRSPPRATSPGWPRPCPTTIERRRARGWSRPTGSACGCSTSTPRRIRLAYDVVSNEVLWFAHHGLWDLTREPAFDARVARRVGRLPSREPRLRRRGGRGGARRRRRCSCRTTTSASSRRGCAPRGPTSTCVHFHHTPFAPPVWLRALPEAAARELLEGLAAHRACGFHSQRWADDFRSSARAVADLEPPTFVAPLASDPADIRAAAASPECDAALDGARGGRAGPAA